MYNVGCPRIDLLKNMSFNDEELENFVFANGVGNKFPISSDFFIVSQHPVTGNLGLEKIKLLMLYRR